MYGGWGSPGHIESTREVIARSSYRSNTSSDSRTGTQKTMPRISFYPKAIKSRIDDFVIAQNRAKRILSTAMHNQRLLITLLEQYQRDLLADERDHAEALRREASESVESDILTDFEGQSEGRSRRNRITRWLFWHF